MSDYWHSVPPILISLDNISVPRKCDPVDASNVSSKPAVNVPVSITTCTVHASNVPGSVKATPKEFSSMSNECFIESVADKADLT